MAKEREREREREGARKHHGFLFLYFVLRKECEYVDMKVAI